MERCNPSAKTLASERCKSFASSSGAASRFRPRLPRVSWLVRMNPARVFSGRQRGFKPSTENRQRIRSLYRQPDAVTGGGWTLTNSSLVTRLKRCATLSYVMKSPTLDSRLLGQRGDEAGIPGQFRRLISVLFSGVPGIADAKPVLSERRTQGHLYLSTSHYVSETVPTLASDQRIMRFKFVKFQAGVAHPMMLKELSTARINSRHSLGMCLLFRNTNSLFLVDEPETHFNPDWRSNFITRLRQCFSG